MRFLKPILLASFVISTAASAALFDTIDSVETIQKVAAKREKTDRMPAGEKADDESASSATKDAEKTDSTKPE